MSLQTLTAVVILVNAVLLIAYDVWVKVKDPTGNSTISWVLLSQSKHFPIICGALFFLMGHIFAPNCP